MRGILRLYWGHGKENGNYYLGIRGVLGCMYNVTFLQGLLCTIKKSGLRVEGFVET